MNRKKLLYIIGGVAAAVAILAMLYCRFASVTRVATLNFPDFTVEKFIRSNDNPFIKINPIGLDEAEKIAKYDIVLVRIHGSSLNGTHLQAIQKAIAKGVPVYATESDNPEINTLSGRELEYIDALMANGSIQNYRSLFNYVRKHIDRKALFNEPYAEPVPIPEDYYFHLGDDQFFATYEEYQKFYEESGRYREGAPRVALLSGNINMQNSNEEHMAAIINSLEERGLNVYPINSFGMKKLGMIRAVAPDVIINRPHGRLVMGGGESGTRMLRELNVPILAPVTVSDLYENWLTDRQGMASGGMTSMSIVMPELDGAVAPYAVAAQFERNGMKLFDAIPVHTEKFCSLVEHYARLHDTPNSEKKVAIYYYKGAGKGAVSAADIEGVQSLYNTLKALRDAGYDVSGLPADAAALERMIHGRREGGPEIHRGGAHRVRQRRHSAAAAAGRRRGHGKNRARRGGSSRLSLRSLLSLDAQGVRCGRAHPFRDARQPRIHSRQAGGAVGLRLDRCTRRRHAPLLHLHHQ